MGLKRQQSVNVNPSKTDQACKHQHSLTANDRNNSHSNRRRDHVRPILAAKTAVSSRSSPLGTFRAAVFAV